MSLKELSSLCLYEEGNRVSIAINVITDGVDTRICLSQTLDESIDSINYLALIACQIEYKYDGIITSITGDENLFCLFCPTGKNREQDSLICGYIVAPKTVMTGDLELLASDHHEDLVDQLIKHINTSKN